MQIQWFDLAKCYEIRRKAQLQARRAHETEPGSGPGPVSTFGSLSTGQNGRDIAPQPMPFGLINQFPPSAASSAPAAPAVPVPPTPTKPCPV